MDGKGVWSLKGSVLHTGRGLVTVCEGRRDPGNYGVPGRNQLRAFSTWWLCGSLLFFVASYFDALVKVQQFQGTHRGILSWNDLQAAVSQVNEQVQEETDRE